jgi:D-alanyl-D-alanine carboxypeptidase
MKKLLFVILMFLCVKVEASIVVMDAYSGRVLYEKNMNERKLIASTTKIMTSIIALENGNLNDKYIVGDEIKEVDGSSIYAKIGEEYSLEDLLYGLMLRSGNDASMIISKNVMGYEEFIAKMNIKAFMLGMNNTNYENPHGLNYDTNNYSTAYDLAILMKYAIKNKEFLKITSTKKYKSWYNKNELLTDYKYLISGKIGYTKKSGQVFVSAAKKDNKMLIVASIDEADKFNLHKRLYEEYFNQYDLYKVLDKNTFTFKNKGNKHYYIMKDFYMLFKDNEKNNINIKITLNFNNSFVSIYYKDKVIHNEKLYKIDYKERMKSIKQKLLFFKG